MSVNIKVIGDNDNNVKIDWSKNYNKNTQIIEWHFPTIKACPLTKYVI